MQFFPAVDHAILRNILFKIIADDGQNGPTRWLIDQILNGGAGVLANEYDMVHFPGDDDALHRSDTGTLHERSSTVYPVTNGIPFLGFVTYPSHRLLKRRNGIAFARRFRAQLRQLSAGVLDYADVAASVQGWLAHAAHGNTYGLRWVLVGEQIIPKMSH